MSEREIRKTIEIDASAEVVFKALSDPEELTHWFPDQAILEPKVGGKMKFTFYKKETKDLNMDFFPEGTILELIPNKKISYTWEHPYIPDFPRTIVTWELEKVGEKKTRVNLVHSGFVGKKNEMFEEHNTGWTYFLNRLVEYCRS